MGKIIIYDKSGKAVNVPSREFLSMMIIMLRKCQTETGMSLMEWLCSFKDIDPSVDDQLRGEIKKLLDDAYPEQLKPLNMADADD